jgi:hypothetical protein
MVASESSHVYNEIKVKCVSPLISTSLFHVAECIRHKSGSVNVSEGSSNEDHARTI